MTPIADEQGSSPIIEADPVRLQYEVAAAGGGQARFRRDGADDED